MLLSCTNKGCYQTDHHTLDEATEQVICLECGKPVDVAKTTIATLKRMKQVKKRVASGIQATCAACKVQDNPVLKKLGMNNYIAVCRKCSAKLDMHPSFIEAMKEMGGYKETDDPEARKVVTDEKPSETRPKTKQGSKTAKTKDADPEG